MGRKLDRSKGAGKTHDAERDPGHYVDLADDGAVMGVLPLAQLPTTREEYDTQDGLWCGRSVAERGVRPDGVVVPPAVLDQQVGFVERREDLAVDHSPRDCLAR